MTQGVRALRGWTVRYAALIRTAWLVDLQYNAAILLWLLYAMLEPVISLGIWWTIAGAGPVQGYDRAAFARYFFAVVLVNQATVAWDAFYIDQWIRGGEMNFRLARPIAPIHEAIADNIAYKLRTATLMLLLWLIIALLWPPVRLPFHAGFWLLGLVATVLAAWIRFLNGYATGLLAFWITRATALVNLQYGVSTFLSGRIAPLSLLPAGVTAVASWLWFPYMLSFPVELVTGQLHGAAILRGFALQLAWAAIWMLACTVVWRRGIRRYAAVGG